MSLIPAADPDPEPDRVLTERIRADADEAAFRTLYRRHTPRAWQYALRLTGGHAADAEDLIQDMWLGAIRGLPRFRWDSSFATWLSAIVLNAWRHRMRRRDPEWLALPESSPDPEPPDLADQLDLERALAALPPARRAIVLMHDWEGLTHEEIAERLGIAPGTSKSQLFHARARLRTLLAPLEAAP